MEDDELLKDLVSQTDAEAKPTREWGIVIAKSLFTIILVIWGFTLITTPVLTWVPLDYSNFLIHESGHIIFNIFGLVPFLSPSVVEFLVVLGGSLTQTVVPCIVLIYFLTRKNWYATLFCLFWLGDNLINVSFYIADSQCQCIPLISLSGGEAIHDWHYLLSQMGLLLQDKFIGGIVFWIGAIGILLALLGMVGNIIFTIYKPTKTQIISSNEISS